MGAVILMDEPIVVGIDIGTTKVCTLVARVEGENSMRILGVGVEPSQGIRKGTIVDLGAASQAIARSVEKAQRTSGLEVASAIVSLAGSHVSSVNSRGWWASPDA
jgi:cell division protein FtsA